MSVVASDEVENTGGFAKSRSFYSSFCFSPSSWPGSDGSEPVVRFNKLR